MFKSTSKSAFLSFLVIGSFFISSHIAFALQRCMVDGEEVPCDETTTQAVTKTTTILSWGLVLIIVGAIIIIWMIVFWIMMLVHAIKHEKENKAIWVIVMVITSFFGALAYYFIVKRKLDKDLVAATTVAQEIALTPESAVAQNSNDDAIPGVTQAMYPLPTEDVAPAPAPTPIKSFSIDPEPTTAPKDQAVKE